MRGCGITQHDSEKAAGFDDKPLLAEFRSLPETWLFRGLRPDLDPPARILPALLARLDLPVPDFDLITTAPMIIGPLLIGANRRLGRVRAHFIDFTVIRGDYLVLWKVLPQVEFGVVFTAWPAALAG